GRDLAVGVGDLEPHAALELDAVVEAADGEADDADQDEHTRGGIPPLAVADEVDVRLTAVELAQGRHQLSPPSCFLRVRARRAAARSAADPACGVVRRRSGGGSSLAASLSPSSVAAGSAAPSSGAVGSASSPSSAGASSFSSVTAEGLRIVAPPSNR